MKKIEAKKISIPVINVYDNKIYSDIFLAVNFVNGIAENFLDLSNISYFELLVTDKFLIHIEKEKTK